MLSQKIHFLLSVQTKIIFVAILVITVVLGAYAAYETYSRKEFLGVEINELANITIKRLENNLKIPLWNIDKDLVADTVEAEMLTRDITAILVFDSNGSDLIVGRQRNSDWNVIQSKNEYQPSSRNEIRKTVTIKNNKESIGTVVIYVDDQFKTAHLHSSVIRLLLILVLLDVVIFIVLWTVMTKLLRTPMLALSDAANKISRGGFTADFDTSRRDEIGSVANSVERMKTSLNMAMTRLRQLESKRKSQTLNRDLPNE